MFPKHLRGLVPASLWGPEEGGTNDEAKRHLMAMFPDEEAFATPKPEALLERVVHIASDPGDLVIDFFAGSGTTAAVSHKMGRRWIAVERSPSTVTAFAIPRLAKVVRGEDQGGISQSVDWHGGGTFVVGLVGERVPEQAAIEVLIEQHNLSDPPAERAAFGVASHSRSRSTTPTLFDEESGVDHEIDVA
jgi:adenine-specific DNA-methyltransferase